VVGNGKRACAKKAHRQITRRGQRAATAINRHRTGAARAVPDPAVVTGDGAASVMASVPLLPPKLADNDVSQRMADRAAAQLQRAVVDRGTAGISVGAGQDVVAGGVDELRRACDDNGRTARETGLGEVVRGRIGRGRVELEGGPRRRR